MGLLPDGDPPDEMPDASAPGSSRPRDTAIGVRQALHTRTLWTLVIAFNLSSIAFSAIGYHLLPYYTDIGFSLQTASLLMALTQTIATFSKLPWGLIAEKVPVRYCLIVVVLGRVGGLLSLLLFTSPLRVFGFVFIAGSLTYVMGPLQSQIWADYYGRSFIGSIRGILAPFTLISSLLGPIFAAFIYDQFGSYEIAFWTFVVTLSFSAVAFFFAKPPSLVPTNQRP
jgi:MFS family permease